ncbi:unnamed protein product [Symbiodinium necroappetens]|uniref:Uncharacterized protein n=1 Tax=Symbiodinium necroappetens TaxID=1628268 RepID=A0A812MFZ1_9DINO|nr:unnamed protein product [Symbiodinium necroappetens]CAE7467500.1 unnamed protein product [Symbiodinium microadriaticum]
MSWEEIFPKKPMDRLRWLFKACKAAKEGRIKPNPLYNVVAHRRFLEGLKGSIATDCLNLIRGHIHLFSPKQQKQLQSDNFELFRKYAPISVLDSDDDEDAAPPLPPPPEVHVEMKDKKRKRGEQRKQVEEEEEFGFSDDETEVKKARILAKGIERRIDPADGQAYSLEEFITEYGGSGDKPPVEWENSKHTSMLGCMCPTFHSVLTMANSSKLQMPLRQSAVLALCWRVTDAVGERLQGRSNRCEIRRFIYKE